MFPPSKNVTLLPTLFSLFMSVNVPAAFADPILGFEFGGGLWYADTDGTMQAIVAPADTDNENEEDETAVNAPVPLSELNVAKRAAPDIYIAYTHSFPLVPQLKARHTQLNYSQISNPANDLVFDDQTFPADSEVTTKVDITWQDIELYYRLLDSWVTFDLGANVSHFKFETTLSALAEADETDAETGNLLSATRSVSEQKILLLTHYSLALPETHITFAGRVNYLNEGDTKISDADHYIRFEWEKLSSEMVMRLGYRTRKYTHAFDTLDLDLKSSGYYFSLGYAF
ncbi:hypothetical protein TDB9533_02276 [Thalassocella blandensis]|nr:hypothetical protein TDB9533_02276 [Thalassocella blandensis]